jgi:phospholipid/cholesterol/gamma-HCH transport system substrate-binding protein
MKTRTVEIWVGFFVVFGIASLLMLALQVSGLSSFYQRDEGYKVYAYFHNIGGLKVRSKVTLGGVKIGRVTAISLKQNAYKEYQPMVEMTIGSAIKNLSKDSTAKILTAGLLGDNYIGIEPGQDEKFLEDGDVITITSQALLLEELISKFAVGK